MATTFYLPSSGSAPLGSLAVDANWERTDGLVRLPCATSKANTALTTTQQTWPGTTTVQWVWYQFQSAPLAAPYTWTAADTVSMVLGKLAETTNSGDTHLAYSIRVVSGDGATVRGTMGLYHATSTEFPLMASAATRIHSARTNGATAFTSYAGDRVIIELGLHGVTPAAQLIQMRVGDPSATSDFALTAALTTDLCPWVQLSKDLLFGTAVSFAPVQNNVGTGDTIALTGVTAGNLIVIYLNAEEVTGATASITDGTSALTMATAANQANHEWGQFGYLLVANGGNKTYTITWPAGADYKSVIIWEFDYGSGTLSVDDEDVGTGSSTSPATASITTTGTDEIVFGGEGNYAAYVPSAHAINALAAGGVVTESGTNYGTMWWRCFNSTFTGTASCTITTAEWVCNAISFKVSSGYSLVCAGGSYAVTGTAATPKRDGKIVPEAGSYALTGQAAGAYYGRVLDVGAGAYALTGADVAMPRTYKVVPEAGVYALTGQDIGALLGRLVSAEAGVYALTGAEASALYGRAVAAGAGAYTLSGSDVTMPRTFRIVPEAGTYALTGQDVGALLGRLIAAEAGTYALTGQAAALLRGFRIAIDAGSYLLSGQDAAALLGRRVTADAGAYAITGQDVTLVYTPGGGAYIITAEGGVYAVTGADVGVLRGAKVAADAGAYVVTGQDAATLLGRLLDAGAGTYALTGTDAALIRTARIAAEAGAYALTGQDAATLLGRALAAEVGVFTISGETAALLRNARLAAEAGTYLISGESGDLLWSGTHITPVGIDCALWKSRERCGDLAGTKVRYLGEKSVRLGAKVRYLGKKSRYLGDKTKRCDD